MKEKKRIINATSRRFHEMSIILLLIHGMYQK